MSDAKKFESAMNFIFSGIGDIDIERVVAEYDVESEILNVVFRLPDNAVLSVSKRLMDMDDDLVAFNLYSNKKLLVADYASISSLSDYIRGLNFGN